MPGKDSLLANVIMGSSDKSACARSDQSEVNEQLKYHFMFPHVKKILKT